MREDEYRGRRVLVVGLARSGRAAADLLIGRGARVRATDLRSSGEPAEAGALLRRRGAEIALGAHPEGWAREADLVVVSPGVPSTAPVLEQARAAGVPVWSELELGARAARGPIVAVTGTKGKSTTSSLIASILEDAARPVVLAGNIGRPLSGVVDAAPEGATFVLEVSSFQLEAIDSFRPRVAVLLNVTPDHLDRHPSFEDYVRAKQRLFENQEAGDDAVVYGGNPLTVSMASRTRARRIYFDLDCLESGAPHLCLDGPWIVKHEDGEIRPLVPRDEVCLRGRHNLENVMAAAAAAHLLEVEVETLRSAVSRFRGLPHALEKIAEVDGVSFYNDSKATNIAATRAALESFEGGVLLILGGRSKGSDFAALRPPVERKVKRILAIGETRDLIARTFGDLVSVDVCGGLAEAVRGAFAAAEAGDAVLLSPACASFDMFADYAERGRYFREVVEKLTRSAGKPRGRKSSRRESGGRK